MADPQTTPLTATERQALIQQIETVIQTRIAPGGSFTVDGELTLIEQQQYMRAMVEFFHARQNPGDGVTIDGVVTDQEKALIRATPQAMILESIDAMQTPETYTDAQLMSLLSAVNNVAGEMERTAAATDASTPPPPAPPAPPSAPVTETVTEVLTTAPVIALQPLRISVPAITPAPVIEENTPEPEASPTQNTARPMSAAPQPGTAIEGSPLEPAQDAAPEPALADQAAEDRRWLLQHATSNEAVGRAVHSFGNPQGNGTLTPGDMYRLQAASPEEIATFMEGLRAQGIAPPREGAAPAAPAAEPQAPAPRDGQTVRDTNWLLQNATRNEAVGRAIDGIGAGGAGHNDGKLTPEDMYRLQAASPEAVAAVMAQLRTQGITPPEEAAHVSDPARTPVQPLDPHGAIGLATR